MAYPYKKMTPQDCDYIRSVTAPDRVGWERRSPANIIGMRCRSMVYISRICTWKL